MESIDLTQLVQAAAALIFAVISSFVVPWLRATTDEKQRKNIRTTVETLVKAAEQLFKGEGLGPAKCAYVLSEAERRGLENIKPIIEAAVLELKNQLALQNKD